jgi:hypothetical protein
VVADDQVLMSDADDALQRTVHTSHITTKQFGVEISTLKSKVMAFKGQDPIRCNILTANALLEQVNFM